MTQDRPKALLRVDGTWEYYNPNINQGNGMIVTPETTLLQLVDWLGITLAQKFMGEFMVPLLYEHTFTYSFKVVTPLDDDRDIGQVTIHKALLRQIEKNSFNGMEEKIEFVETRKL